MSTIQKNNSRFTALEARLGFLCTIAACITLGYQGQKLEQTRKEKAALQQYADTARNFANRIQPDVVPALTNFPYCDNSSCMTCHAVKFGHEQQAKAAYSNALQTLKINPVTLQTLQKGPTLGE